MSSVSIQIDHKSDNSVRNQIVDAYAAAIQENRLKSGARLPSIRALAARLKVSPATVVAAYRELQARSLVSASPRSSFSVAGRGAASDAHLILRMNRIEPDLRIHPVQEFLRLLPGLGEPSIGGYEDYRGFFALRETLSGLDRSDGIATDPATEILVTSGAQQAITLIARCLGPGAAVAVEDPCFPGARLAFRNAGVDIIPVAMTQDGPDPASLSAIARSGRVSAFYCCPTYGNPTGFTWSLEARLRVLEAARTGGFMVVEDDYLGDLDYLSERPARLASLAADFPSVRVTRVHTFSKTLLPALRLAGVSGKADFIDRLLAAKVADDIGCSAILQRGLDRFIRDGLYAAHLERVRPRYRASREALRRGLAEIGPDLRFDDPPAGLSLLGYMTQSMDPARFVSECAREDIVVTGGGDYWLDGTERRNTFRIGFGSLSPDEILRATRGFSAAARRAREYSVDHSLI